MNILQKIRGLIKRGVITLVGGDTGTYSRAQVSFMGKVQVVEIVYPYGLYANAPKGGSVLLFNVNGQEENIAGIAYDALSRFKSLKEGEVIIGNPKSRAYIKFAANGDCEIYTDGKIALGAGGLAVARLGDAVAVDPSTHIGTITAGSTKVTSI